MVLRVRPCRPFPSPRAPPPTAVDDNFLGYLMMVLILGPGKCPDRGSGPEPDGECFDVLSESSIEGLLRD